MLVTGGGPHLTSSPLVNRGEGGLVLHSTPVHRFSWDQAEGLLAQGALPCHHHHLGPLLLVLPGWEDVRLQLCLSSHRNPAHEGTLTPLDLLNWPRNNCPSSFLQRGPPGAGTWASLTPQGCAEMQPCTCTGSLEIPGLGRWGCTLTWGRPCRGQWLWGMWDLAPVPLCAGPLAA